MISSIFGRSNAPGILGSEPVIPVPPKATVAERRRKYDPADKKAKKQKGNHRRERIHLHSK